MVGLLIFAAGGGTLPAEFDGEWIAGPAWSRMELKLQDEYRTEGLGPLWSREISPHHEEWGLHPVFSYREDWSDDSANLELFYPLLYYDRFGDTTRFQLLLTHYTEERYEEGRPTRRFTFFPFFFAQRSRQPTNDYTAILPFYGKLKGRLLRDEIRFFMWPAYLKSRKADVVTYNYFYPLFHWRRGERLHGWQFWPLVGHESKTPKEIVDSWDNPQVDPGHEKWFALWPFFFDQTLGMGTENPSHEQMLLPFYAVQRSPLRDRTTALFPFFTYIDDRGRGYREWHLPWPFVMLARGEGKTMNRFWPFYGEVHDDSLQRRFFLWPVYRHQRQFSPPLESETTQILFFVYRDRWMRHTETEREAHRRDLWPLFTWRRGLDQNESLQILAPLEPFFGPNPTFERNLSPIWSIWRSEFDAETKTRVQSLLWNTYWRKSTPEEKKVSLFFGLLQYRANTQERAWRLFYLPPWRSSRDQ